LLQHLQKAIGIVAFSALGTLPQQLRVPAAEVLGGVNGIVDGLQDTAAALAKPPKLAIAQKSVVSDKLVEPQNGPSAIPTKKPNRPLLNLINSPLNVVGHGVTGQNDKDSVGLHRLGAGKTPVKDLIKKVLDGPKKKQEDPADSQAPE
jgi:hypothetical protein